MVTLEEIRPPSNDSNDGVNEDREIQARDKKTQVLLFFKNWQKKAGESFWTISFMSEFIKQIRDFNPCGKIDQFFGQLNFAKNHWVSRKKGRSP